MHTTAGGVTVVTMGDVRVKRIYDSPVAADGTRVLVDRLWPRGVSKERAKLDDWNKDVAPSPDLRTWWDHDPDRMDEFAHRYQTELDASPAARELADSCRGEGRVTLLYAARDPEVNHGVVLRDWLTAQIT